MGGRAELIVCVIGCKGKSCHDVWERGMCVCVQAEYAIVSVCAVRGVCGCALFCDHTWDVRVGMDVRVCDAGRVCVGRV